MYVVRSETADVTSLILHTSAMMSSAPHLQYWEECSVHLGVCPRI